MTSLNRVFLAGNLTKDPEIRETPSGMAVGELRMAVTRKFRDKSGDLKDDTLFVSVDVWDKQAKNCGEYLRKGSPVLVEGRLKLDEWEKDGQKLSRLRVVASNVQFLSGPRSEGRREGGAAPAPKRQEGFEPAGGAASEDPGGPDRSPPAADEDDLPF